MLVFYRTPPSHEVTLKHEHVTVIFFEQVQSKQVAASNAGLSGGICLLEFCVWRRFSEPPPPDITSKKSVTAVIRHLTQTCRCLSVKAFIVCLPSRESWHRSREILFLWLVQPWHPPGCMETEPPQDEPQAPSLSMRRQTVVFRSRRALKSRIYASLEKTTLKCHRAPNGKNNQRSKRVRSHSD